MLDPSTLAEFRKNVAAQDNRAIFEIPEILAKLLGDAQEQSRSTMPATSATVVADAD
jgi:hypothetical protein